MDISGPLAPMERPEPYLVFPVSSPKERIRLSKSFEISLGLACQNYWDVAQSVF
jgi:hypothetical protein